MFRRLACWWGGHRHPDHDHERAANVALVFWGPESLPPRHVRCVRCGTPFMLHPFPRKKRWPSRSPGPS